MSTTITKARISELLTSYRGGDLSPVEVVESCMKKIEREEEKINAFISLADEQTLLAEARAAEDHYERRSARGPLLGIPIAVKDNIGTRGLKTTGGSKLYGTPVPDRDARSVELLREAGAIIIGKTNIGFGPRAQNLHFGDIRNPWNLEMSPGASSSGSAAAVAAGMVAASVGTDTGGSIRVPCAFCGVVGLKPSKGLVSTDGVIPTVSCPSLDHVGPVTRSVEDASLLLHVMREFQSKDASKFLALPEGVKGLRIGTPKRPTFWPIESDAGVERNFFESVDFLRELGADVSEIDLPRSDELRGAYRVISQAERASIYALEQADGHPGGEAYVSQARRGLSISAASYLRAQEMRKELSVVYDKAFRSLDALVTPTVSCVSMRSDGKDAENLEARDLIFFTSPFNLTGQPAISVPNGFSHSLPTGLQFVGSSGKDDAVLAIASSYERATPWSKRHPPD